MSFVVTVYVPEAIVMASDSRQTLTLKGKVETVNSDFTYKTFLQPNQQGGVSTFGQAVLGGVSVQSRLERFAEEMVDEEDDVEAVAHKLVNHLHGKYRQADTGFYVAGYKREGRASVPHVYYCHVKKNLVQRRNVNPKTNEVTYGATWAGQVDVITRLLKAKQVVGPDGQLVEIAGARINWHLMNVQDAIDFAIYAVRTTIDTMRFEARPKNVGGPIDVLLITAQGSRWIQRKELHGQPSLSPDVT
ncbi:MAG: hypothetical protein JSU97_02225 [Dehalococcoidia bacterium]|nr:MAG: hypothetical protein JSU97_02225 [Dehalococcoidia bacterium]